MASILSLDLAGRVSFTSDEKIIQLQVAPFDLIQHVGPKSKIPTPITFQILTLQWTRLLPN